MTDHASTDQLRAFEVRSDESLELLVQQLLIDAYSPRVWLLFFDERGRLTDPLLPIDDLPPDACARVTDDMIGDASHAAVMTDRAGRIASLVGADSVALVWERPGRGAIAEELREWIGEVERAAPDLGVALRAQVLLSAAGARVVTAAS